jgi:TusA-related sulfurtransferase
MSARKVDAFVDITSVVCPITFVKVKVALEELADGQILEIRMNAGEPILNAPRSLKEEGHKILEVEASGESMYTVWVQKDGLA